MSPRPDVGPLPDADPDKRYVRRILPTGVFRNQDTGELELLPQKAFVFDPDLSIHQVEIIEHLRSTVEIEYVLPPNGAVAVPARVMTDGGAYLKATPHTEEPVLGPAHHSIFGATLTPTKADKALMRDTLIKQCQWLSVPVTTPGS